MTLRISPPVQITPTTSHRFREGTLADVAASVTDRDEVGWARFRFDLDYRTANSLLTRVDLTVKLTIGMPAWAHRRRRPQMEQDEWDRFSGALRHHEDGHITIFRREAPETYDCLLNATPATINDVLKEERQRILTLSDAYDHRTDHGRQQQTPHGTTEIQVP